MYLCALLVRKSADCSIWLKPIPSAVFLSTTHPTWSHFMQSFRNPKWVFLVNTGPVALLLALGYGEFFIIQTLRPPASVAQW